MNTPRVTDFEEVQEAAKELWDIDILDYKLMESGFDDRNFFIKIKKNQNILRGEIDELTLKIVGQNDQNVLESILYVMHHLHDNGVPCPKPISLPDGSETCLRKFSFGTHFIRLQTYIHGIPFEFINCEVENQIFYDIGKMLAKIHKILDNTNCFTPLKRDLILEWDIKNLHNYTIKNFEKFDLNEKAILKDVINEYKEMVMPHMEILQDILIHGDFHDQNILVQKNSDGSCTICGVLDLGDAHYSKKVFDIGICIMYMSLHNGYKGTDIKEIGGHVLAGYLEEGVLTDLEMSLLKFTIQGKMAACLINKDDICTETCWKALDIYMKSTSYEIQTIWESIINFYRSDQTKVTNKIPHL